VYVGIAWYWSSTEYWLAFPGMVLGIHLHVVLSGGGGL
jgi:hypothetical protein